MALWFIAEDGRKAYKPPYTKAEQMEMYKRYAQGPKVMVRRSVQQPLAVPDQPMPNTPEPDPERSR